MGWMKTKSGVWGDEPQDIMDGALRKMFGKAWYDKQIPLDVARQGVRKLLGNRALRTKIDKIFKRVWRRKATDAEYKGHIWGLSSINRGRKLPSNYMGISRIFNGKKYLLNNQTATQGGAQAIARDLRSMGYLARVYHHPSSEPGHRWWVFRRAKR